jgi:hypothetical protein
MTRGEVSSYLRGEEMLPVTFLSSCDGLGFTVDQSSNDADVPQYYRASMPFWLASTMKESGMVGIDEPPWLKTLGPGAHLDAERSLGFAAKISVQCGDRGVSGLTRLTELCQERIDGVLTFAMTTTMPRFDQSGQEGQVFLSEEKEMIEESRKSLRNFAAWKAGDTRIKRRHIVSNS